MGQSGNCQAGFTLPKNENRRREGRRFETQY
ncbi:hypothetical protein X769_26805 [Mesorhizobium sp. LSJC268A00]|nr:hypothetical protein X771_24795 [Mesorhizobium sp. LSJC277A00]ESW96935.1 hypothetical protein X769_26805 [Mesorhizobium sp. LSJC268A00]ESX09143.1 hypothetical protein X768_20165 [Mesorhizobium sp. LSJC265A00]ESX47716.1 hypothetical protein X762_17055 [Mesorhizobium sp. LSHC426A00]ESX50764.1 hypothetical protein X761_25660 [Mesorhizobium sp. LSHC424B00]ESX66236.1 hypothetical protein X758_26915 [Mesorhizobium sp. LSHC416B00]ESX91826.1 hypothetical protein X755_26465 [Mesorhizobium sp. LNJC4